jgi:hypothetical protein
MSSSFTSSSSQWSDTTDDESSSDEAKRIVFVKIKKTRRRRVLEPKANAPWQRMLDKAEEGNGVADPSSIDGRYFRRRFRIPYALFKTLIKVMLDDDWFPGDFEVDGRGKCCSVGIRGASLHVKVLSCLRVLGRGVCFDEAYDGSGLHETVICRFFHKFVDLFVTRLFHQVVHPPRTPEELEKVCIEEVD